MATSTRAFLIELYEEYLEEASFLYEQRLSLLRNPEISWTKIGEFEERFEAHIDGLVVGGDLALDVCKRRALEGDFGELHAAMRVFCRQNRRNLAFAVLEETDLEDLEKVRAIGDALKYELPATWYEDFWQFAGTKPVLVPLLTTTLAYQRVKVSDLAAILQKAPPQFLEDVIWACGRLCDSSVCPQLRKYLEHQDPAIESATAIALLRLGDESALDSCLRSLGSSNWPAIPVGLAGSHTAVRTLVENTRNEPFSYDRMIATGLLGDVSVVPALLTQLSNSEVAEAAAISLQLITGAHIMETVFIPEAVDEDELFDEERESLERDRVPMRPDGRPYGTTVTRLAQKQPDWEEWWVANAAAFEPQVRYRYGRPYSPRQLVEVLKSEKSPHLIRKLAYEELVIRYKMDVRFETDMFLGEQEQSLEMLDAWAQRNSDRFRDGCFYFAGTLVFY